MTNQEYNPGQATPSHPPTEAEMGKVADIIKRATDALISLSSLSQQVQALQQNVDALSQDMERLRRTNNALEETVASGRQQRQELEGKLQQALSERDQSEAQRASAHAENLRLHEHANRDAELIQRLTKERDDALMAQMEAEDRAKSSEAKLAAVEEGFHNIFGKPTPPTPSPEPVRPVEPYFTPMTESLAEPAPTSEPETDFSKPYRWDPEKGRYVNE